VPDDKIDLLAILPFYIPLLLPVDLRFLRALRLFRLLRLFKLGRYSRSLKAIGNVLSAKRGEQSVTVFMIFILLILSSSLL
jgi:voltage-gated potassium channel